MIASSFKFLVWADLLPESFLPGVSIFLSQAEDGIRYGHVTGVQTCALPICDSGVYSAGAPGLGEHVIGVASYDNSHIMTSTARAVPSGEDIPFMTMDNAEEPPPSGQTDELVHLGRACLAEGDELEDDPEGKTALIVRGECAFAEKYDAAVEAGATGVVMYNNEPGMFAGGGIEDQGAFSVGISDERSEERRVGKRWSVRSGARQ